MNYIKEVAQEMGKVTWPSFKEVNKYTWTVIVSVILFGLYFGLVDFGFGKLINWLVSL
ncbi:preprotein translocase subunit SecE [Vaginisenegalia massiliensis]|uniref:preprotein translocase subunit SecE n=1 Tax=Vaginisenegalia massiliensis TaxID=2058294 RepID=UPI000F52C168|nr:preprotein translocase subunit SecE [Vaginisenegalia massiliensis]